FEGREADMAVARDDVVQAVEQAVWAASGWKIRPAAVDRLMVVVDEYAAGEDEQRIPECPPAALAPIPEVSTSPEPAEAPQGRPAPVLVASQPVKPVAVPRQRARKPARRVRPLS